MNARPYEDRIFKIWDFSPSHNRLLFRSPRSETNNQTIDIIFHGVRWLSFPSRLTLTGIEIAESSEEQQMAPECGMKSTDQVFVLNSTGTSGCVIAASMFISEHTGDIFDPPVSW